MKDDLTARLADAELAKLAVVLVTGASGYIGSYVVANLLERGMRVRAAARSGRRRLVTAILV